MQNPLPGSLDYPKTVVSAGGFPFRLVTKISMCVDEAPIGVNCIYGKHIQFVDTNFK